MAAGAGAAAGGRSFSFKVVLLGEGCVGKTSLVLRYCENKFNDKHITTLQVRAGRGGRWCGVPLLSPLLRHRWHSRARGPGAAAHTANGGCPCRVRWKPVFCLFSRLRSKFSMFGPRFYSRY